MIYLHIPTVSGMAPRNVIERQFRSGAVWSYRPNFDFRGPVAAFVSAAVDIDCVIGHMRFGLHRHLILAMVATSKSNLEGVATFRPSESLDTSLLPFWQGLGWDSAYVNEKVN